MKDLLKYEERYLLSTLLEHFPIISAKRDRRHVLIDSNELFLQKDTLLQLLFDDCAETDATETQSASSATKSESAPVFGPHKKLGRTPLWIKIPTLIECATNFIKHSFPAHVRRRATTATGNGVSLADIQKHLLKNIPGLEEAGGISRDTIHRLTKAPRKNSIQAHRYQGLIDARVPGKRNQYREHNKNQHFLFFSSCL